MTEKSELQDVVFDILEKKNIEYIHIPNRVFRKGLTALKKLKNFPDVAFLYNGILYMREFGIKNTHSQRKDEQMEKMKKWKKQGADIKVIKTKKQLINDFKKIGVLND